MIKRPFIGFAKAVDLRSRRKLGRLTLIACSAIFLANCAELKAPKVEPFYAVTVPPPRQDLRWTNGKTPKSLDPARAAAAPETDIARAAYEGLTDLDARSLRETPAVAEKWESTEDLRTWTFYLRKDARWSNGERVTANDFVRSWKRLKSLGDKTANSHLFQNIVGMGAKDGPTDEQTGEPKDFLPQQSESSPQPEIPSLDLDISPNSQLAAPATDDSPIPAPTIATTNSKTARETSKFGVEAIDDLTLKVSLELPDKDFPKLVSNPIFRPVYGNGANFEKTPLDPATVTNGAFRIIKIGDDGITLERSDTYWNRKSVGLERVRFVPANSAEAALSAYKKGDVDVVTNAAFAPLALKLLTPFEDFRRTPHSALNFYEFNTAKPPFDDRRVREALAISIDRAKLTDSDLEGTNQPAYTFFPLGEKRTEALTLDVVKAKQLLEKAGYAGGSGFPPIRLVINRNDTQQRVARSVARMWKQNLNIETTIVVKESSEIDSVKKSGDFDLLRRGVVLPTNDELVNLESVLGSAKKTAEPAARGTGPSGDGDILPDNQPAIPNKEEANGGPSAPTGEEPAVENNGIILTLTEEDAIFELTAIPLYFPTSYSLVKPYIRGFEMNGLDALSLKEVSIDNNWKPKSAQGE
jgi:oligopeptide transport system substrate-binding protein